MKLIYDVHAITGAANYLAEHNPIMDASDFYKKIKKSLNNWWTSKAYPSLHT